MEVLEGATTVERMLLDRAKQTKTPANGSIEVTPLCNMNCDMCYVRLSRDEMERQGKLKTGDEWLRLGKQMRNAGVLFLLITGGEPLLHPDFKQIYLGMRELGMIVTVNTNATLIDEQWADFFGKNKPRRINITLYGADDRAYRELCHYPGGFERTKNAVRLLRERGVDVKLSCSLTKANQNDWEKVIRIGEELGVPVREDTYMCPATRERSRPFSQQVRMMPEDAAAIRIQALRAEMGDDLFYQSAAWNLKAVAQAADENRTTQGLSCMAGSCSFAVNWQGWMRPCVISTEPQADAFGQGFQNAWNQIVEETAKIRSSSVCAKCRFRRICNTCAMYALYECGSHDAVPEYICRYTRQTIREFEKHYQQMTAERNAAASESV